MIFSDFGYFSTAHLLTIPFGSQTRYAKSDENLEFSIKNNTIWGKNLTVDFESTISNNTEIISKKDFD